MKKIFENAKLGNLVAKNRLVRSATWEGLATAEGNPEPLFETYDKIARGGIGGVIVGFTSVDKCDAYFGGMLKLYDGAQLPSYAKLVQIIKSQGALALIQIALGGHFRDGRLIEPNELNLTQIREIIGEFIAAATLAAKAGFDGVQLHLAHFFFLSRFISPAYNSRTDEYGGSVENRLKIVREIIAGIRQSAPNLHISAKINSNDFAHGGMDEALAMRTATALAPFLDSIEVSGNGTSVRGVKAGRNEGYFVPFAAALADAVDIPVIAVGGFRSGRFMQQVLDESKIEFLSLSRPIICEPNFPLQLQENADKISACVSCNGCYRSHGHICIWKK